jgi:ATP-dependent DNA helicase 2 subunit 1
MDFEEQEELFMPDQEEGDAFEFRPTRDDVIFLIDCNPSMFEKGSDGEAPYFMVIKAALSFYKDKILAAESDHIAVVLYNTQRSENHMNLDGLSVLIELSAPDAPKIKALQDIIEHSTYKLGHSQALLHDALWLCHDLLSQQKGAASRRIFLFTNEDQPNQNRPGDMRRAMQRARDLSEQDILLELFPFNKRGQQFDIKAFYADVIAIEEDEQAQPLVGAEKLDDLITVMHKRKYKKRTLGRIPFALSPGMSISVGYYCMIRETHKPTPVKLHAQDNKRLKTVTTYVCDETGKQLWEHEIGYHYQFGGKKIVFSKEEAKMMKDFDTPGMKLMGFKNRDKLKSYMNIRPSYFIYPDETKVKGSSQVCHSLLQAMTKLNQIAIVRFLARAGSVMRFCALLPSEDPPGFQMIFLPYADDIRNPESILSKREVNLAPDNLVKAAASYISNVHINDFNVGSYYNPTIQHFYSRLEALALDAPEPPPIIDALEPDEEGMQRKAAFIETFFEACGSGGRKRMHEDKAQGRSKKPSTCKPSSSKYTEVELKKLKVNELKEICEELGIAKSGRKEQLIERILESA